MCAYQCPVTNFAKHRLGMGNLYQTLSVKGKWQKSNPIIKKTIPAALVPYILDSGSLTKSLIALSDNNFQVNVLEQKIALPFFDEQIKLGQALYRSAVIRQVELKIYSEAVVYARSIIPTTLFNKRNNGLASLGKTPLGHLLFQKSQCVESKREYKRTRINNDDYYARRSPYHYSGEDILVTEYFLPSLNKYL